MKKARILILTAPGINCQQETHFAFGLCGAMAQCISIGDIISSKIKICNYDILVLPGGFSYGDDISCGKIFANEIKNKIGGDILNFAMQKKPIIGICNGFQALVKMGLLPDEDMTKQSCTLAHNANGKFECRWVYLKLNQKSKCLWTKNLPDVICLPVAHGQGRFIAGSPMTLKKINKEEKIVFKYYEPHKASASYPFDPNGSMDSIAGISNSYGNVFGLMPHPERFVFPSQYPASQNLVDKTPWGRIIFQNAVDYIG